MTGSLGLGRRRSRHFALVPWAHQFGLGALGQDAGKTMANELYHGGWPAPPIEIPMGWLSGRATWRQDPPFARAEVSQRSGDTGRARNAAAVINGREWVFTATLDSIVDVDARNLAAWVTAYYTDPLPRASAMSLILNSRTPTEIWRILRVVQGSRIRITGTPDADVQLLANPNFDTGVSGWTGDGATLAQSSVWSRSGGFSMQITPVGGGPDARAVATTTVVAGAEYELDGWLFSPGGFGVAAIQVTWVDAAGADISTSSSSVTALVAGVAQQYTATFTAPAGAVTAKVFPVEGGPAAGNVYYADEVALVGPARAGWPDGATDLVVECVSHQVTADLRTVTWALAPIVGDDVGTAGPWFYADSSFTGGTDVVPF